MAARTTGDALASIRVLRPAMSLFPRAIVEAILLSQGSIGSGAEVAQHLGLTNRFKLARMLKQAGLLPLHRLADWAMLDSWMRAAERDGVSLCCIAFRARRHPSACYRLVKELTGLTWGELRQRGLRWFRGEFVRQLERIEN